MGIYIGDTPILSSGGGKSPYEVAKENGYTGTEAEFNAALVEIDDFASIYVGKEEPAEEKFWIKTDEGGEGSLVSTFNGRSGEIVPEAGDYTAEMVGAAPAGFGGYGEIIPKGGLFEDEESFVAWITAKINALPFGASEQVRFALFYDHFNGADWYGTLTNESGYGTLSVMSYSGISYAGAFTYMVRTFLNNAWGPWEYVNPPMELSKEYRTTERYRGKPVYVKIVSFKPEEAISGNKTIVIPHGIDGFSLPIRINGRSSSGYTFPYITSNANGVVATSVLRVSETDIYVCTVNDAWTTNVTWYFDVYYTKTE